MGARPRPCARKMRKERLAEGEERGSKLLRVAEILLTGGGGGGSGWGDGGAGRKNANMTKLNGL